MKGLQNWSRYRVIHLKCGGEDSFPNFILSVSFEEIGCLLLDSGHCVQKILLKYCKTILNKEEINKIIESAAVT